MEHGDRTPPNVGTRTAQGGEPAQERELRAQGRRTMRRLLDAGREVFAERGFHATRVDDVVARAETSHGTFYLYFSNKDDLLRALVRDCEQAVLEVADRVPPFEASRGGLSRLREWIGAFDEMYRSYGPVFRVWIESQPTETEFAQRAADVMRQLKEAFEARIRGCSACAGLDPSTSALAFVAMVERFAYLSPTMSEPGEREHGLDTLARLIHRGLFGRVD